MQIVEIEKIRSYQTLVKKNGKSSYRTTDYKVLSIQIKNQLKKSKVPKITDDTKLGIKLHFVSKRAKLPDIDNAAKFIIDVLQAYYNFDDKQIVDAHLTKSEKVSRLTKDYIIIQIYEADTETIEKKVLDLIKKEC